MQVYITKYALSTGVFITEAEELGPRNPGMISTRKSGYYHGNDWHQTAEGAAKRVAEMKQAAIKSAQRKIDKATALDPMEAVSKAKMVG